MSGVGLRALKASDSEVDRDTRNSCSAIVWCSHFQVWCRELILYLMPKQSRQSLGIPLRVGSAETGGPHECGGGAVVPAAGRRPLYIRRGAASPFVADRLERTEASARKISSIDRRIKMDDVLCKVNGVLIASL